MTLLSGPGGVGKSLVALQAAASVATGREFYGKAAYQGAVVAAFAEDLFRTTHARLLRLTEHMGIELKDLPNLNLVDFTTENEDPTLFNENSEHTPGFARVWRHMVRMREKFDHARLLVLDNAALMFGGDENARRDVSRFGRLLVALAAEFDCAVLLLTHTSKAAFAGNFASGSTAWVNVSRSALTLAPKDNRVEMRHVKSNLSLPMPPLELEILDGVPRKIAGPGPTAAPDTDREMRKALVSALDGYEEGAGLEQQ